MQITLDKGVLVMAGERKTEVPQGDDAGRAEASSGSSVRREPAAR
ncbi:MAG: hypothetical protein ABI606_02685 [Rhodoferax sp.]